MVWALSGGQFPLALAVLQVLALDIGTDLLPAIALGDRAVRPDRVLAGPMPTDDLVDRRLVLRALGVLGPTEAIGEMVAFTLVLLAGGWVWMSQPDPVLLAAASGTAFAAVVLGQLANAFACRSATRWAGAVPLTTNRFLLWAVAAELLMLGLFVGLPSLADLLGGTWPSPLGWLLAALAIPVVWGVDAVHKLGEGASGCGLRQVRDGGGLTAYGVTAQDAAGAALGIRHDVGDEGVVARVARRQLDEPALRGGEVEHLAAATGIPERPGAVAQQVGALRPHRVELRCRPRGSSTRGSARRRAPRSAPAHRPAPASGRATYWLATPLNTTASGVSAAAEAASTSRTDVRPSPSRCTSDCTSR